VTYQVKLTLHFQLIPQIIINHRRHDTTGLQPTMMLLWACAGVPLGVYNIVENFNVALRIQPQILTFLSLITWMQCKYYGSKWPRTRTIMIAIPVAVVMGGIECGLIFALRRAKHNRVEWPITFMAVLSACFLCAGVLRHYWDIYRERTVRGISFLFVGIDALGDLTSLISIFFQPHLDVLGMVIYGSELVLWLGVFACGGCCEWCRLSRSPTKILLLTIQSCKSIFDHGCRVGSRKQGAPVRQQVREQEACVRQTKVVRVLQGDLQFPVQQARSSGLPLELLPWSLDLIHL
jgi:hypothetical protein